MWRLGFNATPNYEDNQLYCGGFANQWEVNGGKCGVCGDPWQGPRENEAGGKYARGVITRRYLQNSTVRAIVELTATHKGWFEFRLCANNDTGRAVTQACLDQHLLLRADGMGARYYVIEDAPRKYVIPLRLPPALTCSQCVLQWKYNAGNSWGVDDEGTACIGCGPQEQFYGCADVAVDRSDFVQSPRPSNGASSPRHRTAVTSPSSSNGTTTDAVRPGDSTRRQTIVTTTNPDGLASSSSHTTLASWMFAVLASLPSP
ncbi:hypothetical protein NP493_19g00017 [Ridgeia piscesae]|uniref:Chitin-binding type-4 domain-containing protein n=1 Tax=Ridgeia piscesae TaxID=27915 RepID=A0AAD9PDP9_RIDPI|nr:hypothetical protein NP493_19g00017 [Ridgeia piscesae]